MEVDKKTITNIYSNRDEGMTEDTKTNPYGFFSETKSAVILIIFYKNRQLVQLELQ
jgi:hypothetical protein